MSILPHVVEAVLVFFHFMRVSVKIYLPHYLKVVEMNDGMIVIVTVVRNILI